MNIENYKYCSSENPTEPIIVINGNQYYMKKYEAYSYNYTSAKNIVKLVYDKLNVDHWLDNKYIHHHLESFVLMMVVMFLKNQNLLIIMAT